MLRTQAFRFETIGLLLAVVIGSTLITPASAHCTKRIKASTPTPQFIDEGSMVTDRDTRLTWDRCTAGENWKNGRCEGSIKLMSLAAAKKYAETRGGGWRVPTIEELSSIIEVRCHDPSINPAIFPNVRALVEGRSPYWSSTPFEAIPTMNYLVDFLTGEIDARSQGFSIGVRLVRGPLP